MLAAYIFGLLTIPGGKIYYAKPAWVDITLLPSNRIEGLEYPIQAYSIRDLRYDVTRSGNNYYYTFLKIFIVTFCQGRTITGLREARLSLAKPMSYYYMNIDGHPGTYSYGYDVSDPSTGNKQFRTEERYPNGTVAGSYGYEDAWGRPQRYRYIADARGYRVTKERPHQPYIPPATSMQSPVDSSITWSRPKRPNMMQNSINSITNDLKKPVLHTLKDREKYFVRPPSYYAED